MKIRKILPLLLLAIGSVFLLSSCDAMLDAIFSNNTINVNVSASIASYNYLSSYLTDSVSVEIVGPTGVSTTAGYTGSDYYYLYWGNSIPKLSNGLYTVTVTYYHPYGYQPAGYSSVYGYTVIKSGIGVTTAYQITQTVSLPAGSSHSVNLDFNF